MTARKYSRVAGEKLSGTGFCKPLTSVVLILKVWTGWFKPFSVIVQYCHLIVKVTFQRYHIKSRYWEPVSSIVAKKIQKITLQSLCNLVFIYF
jgi:hypothetical protein